MSKKIKLKSLSLEDKKILKDKIYDLYHNQKKLVIEIASELKVEKKSVLDILSNDLYPYSYRKGGIAYKSVEYYVPLLDQKFGKLSFIEEFRKGGDQSRYWKLQCSCGKICYMRWDKVHSGKQQDCGCVGIQRSKESKWKGHGEIHGSYLSEIRTSAELRDLCFEVDIEFLWNLFLEQGRKCALTGVELFFAKTYRNRSIRTASLDRIDSSKGYTKDNVRWVHKKLNILKSDISDEEFISWCQKIINHQHTNNFINQTLGNIND